MKIKDTYLVSSCIMSKTLQCKYLKKYDNNNKKKILCGQEIFF